MDGAEISRERRRRGMSQSELAKHVGVSASTVGNWETGRTRPDRSLPLVLDVFAAIQPRVTADESSADGEPASDQDDGLLDLLRDIKKGIEKAIESLGG